MHSSSRSEDVLRPSRLSAVRSVAASSRQASLSPTAAPTSQQPADVASLSHGRSRTRASATLLGGRSAGAAKAVFVAPETVSVRMDMATQTELWLPLAAVRSHGGGASWPGAAKNATDVPSPLSVRAMGCRDANQSWGLASLDPSSWPTISTPSMPSMQDVRFAGFSPGSVRRERGSRLSGCTVPEHEGIFSSPFSVRCLEEALAKANAECLAMQQLCRELISLEEETGPPFEASSGLSTDVCQGRTNLAKAQVASDDNVDAITDGTTDDACSRLADGNERSEDTWSSSSSATTTLLSQARLSLNSLRSHLGFLRSRCAVCPAEVRSVLPKEVPGPPHESFLHRKENEENEEKETHRTRGEAVERGLSDNNTALMSWISGVQAEKKAPSAAAGASDNNAAESDTITSPRGKDERRSCSPVGKRTTSPTTELPELYDSDAQRHYGFHEVRKEQKAKWDDVVQDIKENLAFLKDAGVSGRSNVIAEGKQSFGPGTGRVLCPRCRLTESNGRLSLPSPLPRSLPDYHGSCFCRQANLSPLRSGRATVASPIGPPSISCAIQTPGAVQQAEPSMTPLLFHRKACTGSVLLHMPMAPVPLPLPPAVFAATLAATGAAWNVPAPAPASAAATSIPPNFILLHSRAAATAPAGLQAGSCSPPCASRDGSRARSVSVTRRRFRQCWVLEEEEQFIVEAAAPCRSAQL